MRAAVAAVTMVVLEVVSYRSLKRYGAGLNSIPTVVMEEFPEIDRDLLDKYTSFDAELGWSPQPNTTKQKDTGEHLPGEEVRTVVTYSTDEYGSRVCTAADREDSDVRISTYGDSYCFCREVNDDETFQSHLASKLGTHVGNYGGGNYGLDQSLLRLKRQYPEDPTDYVFMVVTASSIARILSVWKHYQEFGNVLAVKPRYELRDGELELVENPIDRKEDLLHIRTYAQFLRQHDYHYERWFKPHLVSFPYTPDLFGEPDHLRYVFYAALKDLEAEYDFSVPGIDPDERLTETNVRLEQPRVEYHERLFDEESDLFSAIVGEFVSYADEQEFTPVLVMSQQLRYAKYEEEHGAIYGDMMDQLGEEYPDLKTIEMSEHLTTDDGVESLYVERGEGGHYSPETNERIAEVLIAEALDEPKQEFGTVQ